MTENQAMKSIRKSHSEYALLSSHGSPTKRPRTNRWTKSKMSNQILNSYFYSPIQCQVLLIINNNNDITIVNLIAFTRNGTNRGCLLTRNNIITSQDIILQFYHFI